MNAIIIILVISYGFDIGKKLAVRLSHTQDDIRMSFTFKLLRILSLLVIVGGFYACWWAIQEMSRINTEFLRFAPALVGLIPGIGKGFFFASFPQRSPILQNRRPNGFVSPETLRASLSELRYHEWQWIDPRKPLPINLVLHKLLDRILFGGFSRVQMTKWEKFGLSHSWDRFPWECAAIAINHSLAEAYVRRSLDGNLTFSQMGECEEQQGFNIHGEKVYYNIDYAMVDVEIALRLVPDWDWALSVQGALLWQKARPKPYEQVDITWADLARIYLEKSIALSENPQIIQNCQKNLDEIYKESS
jgi:hypothetical protein